MSAKRARAAQSSVNSLVKEITTSESSRLSTGSLGRGVPEFLFLRGRERPVVLDGRQELSETRRARLADEKSALGACEIPIRE